MRQVPVRFTAFLVGMLWLTSTVAAQQAIDIKITTHLGDQQNFIEGDGISFFLSLEREAYVYLFYLDAGSNLLQLLPNQHLRGHRFSQGIFMPVPSTRQPFRFAVGPPFGDEIVIAFASDNGELAFQGKQLENGLTLLDISIDQVEADIRTGSSQFGRSELFLTTRPKPAE